MMISFVLLDWNKLELGFVSVKERQVFFQSKTKLSFLNYNVTNFYDCQDLIPASQYSLFKCIFSKWK